MAKQLTDSEKRRRQLEQLSRTRQKMAELDPSELGDQFDALRKKVNSLTESLGKMGVFQERIDAFYEAFIRVNSSVKEVNTSISNNLFRSIENLNNSTRNVATDFLTPIDDLKSGAKNIIDVLNDTIKSAVELETYVKNPERRDATRVFVQENIGLSKNLLSAYQKLIQNEGNLGTKKFKTLSFEKEIANAMLHITELDNKKTQLAGGYYSQLRLQASVILEMLQDANLHNKIHQANNKLVTEQLEMEKERPAIEREVAQWLKEQREQGIMIGEDITHEMLNEFNEKQAKADQKRIDNLKRYENISRESAIKRGLAIDKEVAEHFAAETKKENADKLLAEKKQDLQNKVDAAVEQRTKQREYQSLAEKIDAINKEVNAYFAAETEKENVEAALRKKMQDAQDKNDEEVIQRTKARQYKGMLDALKLELEKQEEITKIQEQEEKKREQERKQKMKVVDSFLDRIINKLPMSGLLEFIGKGGTVMKLVAILIGVIVKLMLTWDNITANVAKKLSITREAAHGTAKAAGSFASNMGLANIYGEQVLEGLISLSDGLGGLDLAAGFRAGNNEIERMVAGATVLNDVFGLSGNEIAGMTDAATAMGMSLTSSATMAITMSKGIMSANKLMQSIANLAPKILTGFKGSNTELISMVTKMKLLGVEANNVVSSNDKLLDIESSISNAFEAQVATGANINIDKLMALQLTGKYQDVIDEQLKTLQKSDYLNMTAVGQELLASGLGLDREVASQMMLRKILVDKVGLTDELIEQRRKEGKMVEDDIKKAEKEGRITKLEADKMRDFAKEYDPRTMQEKMIRAMDNLAASIGSSFGPLIKVFNSILGAIEGLSKGLSGVAYGLGPTGTGAMSVLGGAALVGGLGYAAKRGVGFAKGLGNILSSGTSGETGTSGTSGSSGGGGFLKNLIKPQTFKGALGGAGLGAAFSLGVDLLQGRDLTSSLIAASASGLGSIGGGMLLGPIGAVLGGMAGNAIANAFLPDPNAQSTDAIQQRIRAKQQALGITEEQAQSSDYVSSGTYTSEVVNAIHAMSAKLDTTNNLLSTLTNKSNEISVELDGEKVGKAVMRYSSENMDRGRIIGSTYGRTTDTTATRTAVGR